MSMEDIMKALMQTSTGTQSTGSVGGDMLSQAIGGALGSTQQSGGGGGLGGLLSGLLGGGTQQQQSAQPATQMLGALEQIIGGTPGSGQLGMNQGAVGMGANSPIMGLLQPVVNQLAAKAGISPEIATVVTSIALHYLLQSHPSTPGASPLNLSSVMQTLASGGQISPNTLQSSGMLNDVMQATGMNQQQATKSINQTFNVLGSQVAGVKGTATFKRSTTSAPANKATAKKGSRKK
jgi:hypothetical protein